MKTGKRPRAKTGFADKSPSAERNLAAELLDGVAIHGSPLNLLAEKSSFANSPPQEKAAAMRLVKDALRNLSRIDSVLGAFIAKPMQGKAKNSLRISVAEIFCSEAASYAVVDQGVRLMKERTGSRNLSGLANAVLRKVAVDGKSHWDSASANRLPKWISGPVKRQFGQQALTAIETAHEKAPFLDITPADGKSATEVAIRLNGKLLPTGSIRLQSNQRVSSLPGYNEGLWWVQDMSAAIPVRILGDVSGMRVLDMCAAPGGKTMQLASAGANVTACDVSANRLSRLRENLDRTGLSAEIVELNALEWNRSADFDAVIVDAPCSATGTIRRNPDIPLAAGGRLDELVLLQDRLLAKAVELVKDGGVIIYCTCSLLAEEGEQRAKKISMSRGLTARDIDPVELGLERGWKSCEGAIRLRPDYWPEFGGMDGFYTVALNGA